MSKQTPDQIRKDITSKIIAALAHGTPPWRQPWNNHPNAGTPANFLSKRRYTGINSLILMGAAMESNYRSRYWGSHNSILGSIGAQVKKGEKASYVTFFKMLPKKTDLGVVEKDAKGRDKMIPLLRQYPIFNIEQCQAPSADLLLDGTGSFGIVKSLLGQNDRVKRTNPTTLAELRQIAEKFLPAKNQPSENATRETIAEMISQGIQEKLHLFRADVFVEGSNHPNYEPAEHLITSTGADIRHGGDCAIYNLTKDYIQVPDKASFNTLCDYYQTTFHELGHWTKPENRVGREKVFDDQTSSYAFEELVAEISACFVSIEIGVPLAQEMLPKSQSYIKHWLQTMQNDPKYIFAASSQASKVVDYLLKFVGKQNLPFENESSDEQERDVA